MTAEYGAPDKLRTVALRLAADIRRLEEERPGFFGETANAIRREAAGDDVPPEELMAAVNQMEFMMWAARAGREAARDGYSEEEAWERFKPRLLEEARRRGWRGEGLGGL